MDTQQVFANHHESGKRDRLEARVSPRLKSLLQHAADLQGKSLTDFVVRSAEETAKEVVREHVIITLSAQDSRAFAQALLHPPKPNRKLRLAYARYKKYVSSQP